MRSPAPLPIGIPSVMARLVCGLALLAALGTGCGGGDRKAGVLLHLKADSAQADRPSNVNLSWYAKDTGFVGSWILPEGNNLLPSPPTVDLLTVFMEQDNLPLGDRIAVVQNFVVGNPYWGAAAVTLTVGTWNEADLVIKAGPMPDSDGDGIPDPVDGLMGACKTQKGTAAHFGCP